MSKLVSKVSKEMHNELRVSISESNNVICPALMGFDPNAEFVIIGMLTYATVEKVSENEGRLGHIHTISLISRMPFSASYLCQTNGLVLNLMATGKVPEYEPETEIIDIELYAAEVESDTTNVMNEAILMTSGVDNIIRSGASYSRSLVKMYNFKGKDGAELFPLSLRDAINIDCNFSEKIVSPCMSYTLHRIAQIAAIRSLYDNCVRTQLDSGESVTDVAFHGLWIELHGKSKENFHADWTDNLILEKKDSCDKGFFTKALISHDWTDADSETREKLFAEYNERIEPFKYYYGKEVEFLGKMYSSDILTDPILNTVLLQRKQMSGAVALIVNHIYCIWLHDVINSRLELPCITGLNNKVEIWTENVRNKYVDYMP